MELTRTIARVVALLVLLLVPSRIISAQDTEIEALEKHIIEAVEQKDASALAELHTPDSELHITGGDTISSKENIEAYYRRAFAELDEVKLFLTDPSERISQITDELWSQTGFSVIHVQYQDGHYYQRVNQYTLIAKREDQRWKIFRVTIH